MKVRIIRPTIAQKRQVLPGEELEVSKQEGMELIGAGKAVAVKEIEVETTDMPKADVEISADAQPAPTEAPVDKPRRTKVKKVS